MIDEEIKRKQEIGAVAYQNRQELQIGWQLKRAYEAYTRTDFKQQFAQNNVFLKNYSRNLMKITYIF